VGRGGNGARAVLGTARQINSGAAEVVGEEAPCASRQPVSPRVIASITSPSLDFTKASWPSRTCLAVRASTWPKAAAMIYLLVSLEHYTAENRDGPWEFITRAGLPVVSSHLADDAAMRNQAGRRVVIKGSSRCRAACLPPGQFNMRPQAWICIAVLYWECSLMPRGARPDALAEYAAPRPANGWVICASGRLDGG
jgi:hypothetical protein